MRVPLARGVVFAIRYTDACDACLLNVVGAVWLIPALQQLCPAVEAGAWRPRTDGVMASGGAHTLFHLLRADSDAASAMVGKRRVIVYTSPTQTGGPEALAQVAPVVVVTVLVACLLFPIPSTASSIK